MLKIFQSFRDRTWLEITSQDYKSAWLQWGGSVATHPFVVERLSNLVEIEVKYFGCYQNNQLVAAVPAWGKYFALSKAVLKKHKKRHFFDLGNAEIIFPQAPNSQFKLLHKASYLSELHQQHGQNITLQKQELALARMPEDYSRKFRYNKRRELRLLTDAGGQVLLINSLTAQQQAEMYIELFEKRWNVAAPAKAYLSEVFQIMQPFITGSFITIDDKPAAYQVLYRVESPTWHSVEYINGGVDPQLNELSPGSVLSFVNTQSEWEYAHQQGKDLRYSFGRADREYKGRWCHSVPVFEIK